MEWDQITDRWAAMTYRLRGNITTSPKGVTGLLQPTRGGSAVEAPDQMTAQAVENDHSQPFRQ